MIDEQVKLDIMRSLAAYYTEVDKLDAEITALRELVRGLRAEVMSWSCACGGPGVEICTRCELLGMIDSGLAKIGKERE